MKTTISAVAHLCNAMDVAHAKNEKRLSVLVPQLRAAMTAKAKLESDIESMTREYLALAAEQRFIEMQLGRHGKTEAPLYSIIGGKAA